MVAGMKAILAATIIAAAFAAPAHAESPLEIRGVALGDSLEQLSAIHPSARCSLADREVSDDTCTIRGYGSVDDAFVMYIIVDGKVESAAVLMDSASLPGTLLAMKAKFGEPSIDDSTVTNAMGASFRNRKATWTTDAGRIVAEERVGRIDKAQIKMESIAGVRASMQRFKAAKAAEAAAL